MQTHKKTLNTHKMLCFLFCFAQDIFFVFVFSFKYSRVYIIRSIYLHAEIFSSFLFCMYMKKEESIYSPLPSEEKNKQKRIGVLIITRISERFGHPLGPGTGLPLRVGCHTVDNCSRTVWRFLFVLKLGCGLLHDGNEKRNDMKINCDAWVSLLVLGIHRKKKKNKDINAPFCRDKNGLILSWDRVCADSLA